MRIAALALPLVLLCAAPAPAETRCEPAPAPPEVVSDGEDVLPSLQDRAPDFTCRSTGGLMRTPERDANGAPVFRDVYGNRVEGVRDGSGVTVYPDVEARLPPPQSRITTFVEPATGIATSVFPSGRPSSSWEQSAVDPLGNSVIRDNAGRIQRCWTDPVGVTSCD